MPPFEPVPSKPDHIALEHRALERWERERTFEVLRDANRGNERFSFIDGPITANNAMGVHHGWGRTIKDIWQRYHAMLGHDQRYQNGFDCQGLWVEVGVEKELGLNSKPEIEEYGLERFAIACRERVATYAGQLTEHSKRLGPVDGLGQVVLHDDRSQHLGHLEVPEALPRSRLAVPGSQVDAVVSALRHLAVTARADRLLQGHHPPVAVCASAAGRARTRVPGGVDDHPLDASGQRGRRGARPMRSTPAIETTAGIAYVAADRRDHVPVRGKSARHACPDPSLSALPTAGRSTSCPAAPGVEHRVVAWDEVSMEEGTGIVHIAPGCGAEDFELGQKEGLGDAGAGRRGGAFTNDYGWLHAKHTAEAAPLVIEDLGQRGRLVEAGELTHRYPVCWRCGTELIYRLVDEWFIRCDEVRQPMIEAARKVEWTPPQYGKRMEDWLRNMGDWCISRKRYWGLPLPFYFCDDGHMTVVSSQDDLLERAISGTENLTELHRPWIDDVVIACDECGGQAHRLQGRGRLLAGRRASCRSRRWAGSASGDPRGVRRGRRRGRHEGRPARPRVLAAVVSGRLGHRDA